MSGAPLWEPLFHLFPEEVHMRKAIAALLLSAALLAGCSRPPAPPAPGEPPSAPGQRSAPAGPKPEEATGATPAKAPAAKAAGAPAQQPLARYDLASLPAQAVPPLQGQPISWADDDGWVRAKKRLQTILADSPKAPAPGLEDTLVAYFGRDDVARLPSVAALRGLNVIVLGGAHGSKSDPPPEDPRIYRVGPRSAGPPAYQVTVLQWLSGGKAQAAVVPERNVHGFRFTTAQGRPRLLTFQFLGDAPGGPLTLSAFEYRDGRLLPFPLPENLPAEISGVKVARRDANHLELQGPKSILVSHPDYDWACFGDPCIAFDWNESGLSLRLAPFALAEAQQRLLGGEENRIPTERTDWAEAVSRRILSPETMKNEGTLNLETRTGARVTVRRAPGAEGRILSLVQSSWLGGKGYQSGMTWLQWSGGSIPYLAAMLSTGGGYIDHRILKDGDRYYLLMLTEAEPRPYSGMNVLSLYKVEGGKLYEIALPDPLRSGGEKRFLSMDGSLLQRCPGGSGPCELLRWENGALVAESGEVLQNPPTEAARQAHAEATERFRAGDYAGAVAGFQKAVALAPGFVDGWNDLSLAYRKLSRWDEALMAANIALQLNPSSGPARYNAGVSYGALGELEEAQAELAQAAKLQPDSPETWMALARVREALRLYPAAQQAYETAARLDPANTEAAEGASRIQALNR
jgi:hypothetical protein